jgi:hypothetical protein
MVVIPLQPQFLQSREGLAGWFITNIPGKFKSPSRNHFQTGGSYKGIMLGFDPREGGSLPSLPTILGMFLVST